MAKKIDVVICTGTACFVMGGAHLLLLADELPEAWKSRVTIAGSPCLELCKNAQNGAAPFVQVNGRPLAGVTQPKLLEHIQTLLDSE